MSLCLSANDTSISSSAPSGWTVLGARLRRMVLSVSEPDDSGDLMPAPSAERVAAIRARRDQAAVRQRAAGTEVNALLL